MAARNGASEITRKSAIAAVGQRRMTLHRPALRALLADSQTTPNVRLSAIAALGRVGEASDRVALAALAESAPRLRFAVDAALKHLPTETR